jgi:hypothetical protein
MPRNGSGTYSLPAGNPVVTGTTISSTVQNNTTSDIATALTNSIAKDGQTTPTANLPMGNFKLTGLAAGTSNGDSLRYEQLVGAYLPLAGGTVTGATTFSALLTASGGVVATTLTASGAVDLNGALTIDGGATATTDITMSAATVKLAKGADVASATALPLITDGNYFDVTGTTTITSFNSMGVGTQITLHFDGALTLTHNATDLVLPGGANITTAAGDEADFIEYASGDWRCTNYSKASGAPVVSAITVGTPVATTSGTTQEFTGIPSTVKRITVMINKVSTNSTSALGIQLGDASSYETTGYDSYASVDGNAPARANPTNLLPFLSTMVAAAQFTGVGYLTKYDGNTWAWSAFAGTTSATTQGGFGSGVKTLTGTLTRLRITTVSGDTFDNGAFNIVYE